MSGLFGEKLLFFDVETTGVDAENGIWSMSGIYERNGKVVDAFHQLVAPFEDDVIHPEALAMSGRTIPELMSYKPPREALTGLLSFMGKHVNKFDKQDKFTMVAYNAQFDDDFLRQMV